MADESLKPLLEALHAKLEGAPAVSESDRTMLAKLAADIQSTLAHSPAPTESGPATLLERVESATTRFEATHPDLSAALLQISKALGDMGI